MSFRVYNKDKPTKWGIKVYVLSDSANGSVVSMEPYFGNQTTESLIRPDLPVTTCIVVHLAKNFCIPEIVPEDITYLPIDITRVLY